MRMKKFNLIIVSISSLLIFSTFQLARSATLSIPDSPLNVTTASDPNIMFLLDDSGSMNNMIWDAGYIPSTVYTDWSHGNWNETSGNIFLGNLNTHNCNTNFVEGTNGGNRRCLRLPNPLGNSTRYSGNYLNYLFQTYGVNGNNVDIRAIIPNDFRMNVARDVSVAVINASANMNFCLQSFNGQQAGGIDVNCTSNNATVTTAINALVANSWTPLAESYYQVTEYFRGINGYTSPITERCQKNYAIVVTDGYPTFDTSFPADDPDDLADGTRTLPNWDNLAPNTTQTNFNNNTIPQYSDGFFPNSGIENNEGFSLFLDDMAKFGYDIDLRKAPDVDSSGTSFDAVDFPKQNLVTFTVGFALNNQMLQDAADYGDGLYFQASNSAGLTTALTSALTNIQGRTSASAAVAATSGFLSTNTGIFLGRYNTGTYTGQLLFFKLNPITGFLDTTGPGPDGSQWDAGDNSNIPGINLRNIYTMNDTSNTAIDFRWSNITATQKALLGANATAQEKLLWYIRGDQKCEIANAGTCGFGAQDLRARPSKLGTIVNSQPIYVDIPNSAYPDTWGDGTGTIPENAATKKYSNFVSDNSGRNPMVYFGANDGMLHAIDASNGPNKGVEQFAYLPNHIIKNLFELSDPAYSHKFYVDGSANVIDAFDSIKKQWLSVLVGGLNKGGQGVYALDVTDPSKTPIPNAASIFKWEFTDADDNDLGYTYGRPAIVRMQNDKWAAIFGNGYNNTLADGNVSTTGNASLFIVFINGPTDTGRKWKTTDYVKIDTKAGSLTTPNGIASVTPIDIDGDKIADYIYGGDLLGNLWKFDVTKSDQTLWKIAFGTAAAPVPLFSVPTEDVAGVTYYRPITTRPTVSNSGVGGFQIHFGTGRYLDVSDTDSSNAKISEHFYGIIDINDGLTPISNNLATFLNQTVTELTATFTDDVGSSTATIRTASTLGNNKAQNWYMELPDLGERQVSTAFKRGNNIIFVTNVPSPVKCDFGGYSWLMELDARDGSQPTSSVFDLSGDGKVNNYDSIDDDGNESTPSKNPAGVRYTGRLSAPTILTGKDTDKKIMTTSAGTVQITTESNPAGANRRHSWRQLR